MKRSEIKRRPLADSVLAGLEAEAKEYRELDGNSLYFRVKPDATKSWQLRYKTPAGKWSWLGLGGYPQVSGALARQKAAELRADLANGKNPILSRKARKEAELLAANSTFEALAREWHSSRLAGWDPGTAKRIIGALELHVFPTLGKRAVSVRASHPVGLPAMRQQFGQCAGRLRRQAHEHILQVGIRIMSIQPRGLDQRHQCGCPLAAA